MDQWPRHLRPRRTERQSGSRWPVNASRCSKQVLLHMHDARARVCVGCAGLVLAVLPR